MSELYVSIILNIVVIPQIFIEILRALFHKLWNNRFERMCSYALDKILF